MFLHLSVSHSVPWGVFRPRPNGQVGGSWGVQTNTCGGVEAHTWGSRPDPEGCIPAGTEADTPQQTATAVGSTHPTGMNSCYLNRSSHSHSHFPFTMNGP